MTISIEMKSNTGGGVLECDEAGAATSLQMGAGTMRGPDLHKGNECVEDGRAHRINTLRLMFVFG